MQDDDAMVEDYLDCAGNKRTFRLAAYADGLFGRSDERRDTPILYVDDMELTWEDLGRALMTYSGWGLRLEIRNCGEE